MGFHSLPKVELHLHLDCSISFDAVRALRPSVSRAIYESHFVAPAKCTDLADFLARTRSGVALLQTERALRLVTADLFRQLAEDNVIYAEIRFAPLLHIEDGLKPERIVAAVNEAAVVAGKARGIDARLILCTLRHFSEAQSLATAKLAQEFRGSLVVALDLAGDEAGFPIGAHRKAFDYAATHGVRRTAHAGEAKGPESIRETLRDFSPSRIGHGVRSVDDPSLVELLRERQIHLEVCPSSNIQTDVFRAYADHPIDRLYRSGISLGVNTDARTTTPLTLTAEYGKLARTFGWGLRELLACNLNAIHASFADETTKQAVAARLQAAFLKQQAVGGRAGDNLRS